MSTTTPVNVPESPMTLGDALSTTFAVLRRRLGLFVGIAALPMAATVVMLIIVYAIIAASVIGVLASLGRNPEPGAIFGLITVTFVAFLVMWVVIGLVSAYAQGLMVNAARETMEHRYPSFAELRSISRGFLGRYVGVYLLLTLGALVGVFVTFLPVLGGVVAAISAGMSGSRRAQDEALSSMGIGVLVTSLLYLVFIVVAVVLSIRLVYIAQVAAAEELSGMAILKRSWALTRNNFWRTLGWLLVMGLLINALSSAVSFIGQGIMGLNAALVQPTSSDDLSEVTAQLVAMLPAIGLMVLLSLAVQLVSVPLYAIYVTVMYGDQVRRSQLPPGYGRPDATYPQGPWGPWQPGQQGWAQSQGRPGPGQAPGQPQAPYGQQSQPGQQGSGPAGQPPYGSGQQAPYGQGQPGPGQNPGSPYGG